LKNRDTAAFKKYQKEVKPLILDLIKEHSFLSQRSIQVALESAGFWHTVVWNGITSLRKHGEIRTAKYPPHGMYPIWVYDKKLRINDLREALNKEYIPLYRKYVRISKEMGHHCENIIEKALNEAGFVTVSYSNDTKYFGGQMYPKRGSLDFIAFNEGVFYGIEVKNYISYPRLEKIMMKKKIADYHEIQFVMISRGLGPYSYECFKRRIMYMEFGKLIWSPKYSSFAEKMIDKFLYPIICIRKPTSEMISRLKKLPKLRKLHFEEY